MKNTVIAAGIALASMVGAANAGTISVTASSAASYNVAYNAQVAAGAVTEDFEGFAPVLTDTLLTSVGTFETIHGATGSGTTCTVQNNPGGTGCTTLAVQQGSINGQGNIVPLSGTKSLSSNDGLGMTWTAGIGGGLFNSIYFAVRDASDQGSTFSVSAAGFATQTGVLTGNGNIQMVRIMFDSAVTSAFITLGNSNKNDAYTVDGFAIAPVPLPAAGLLLIGGLGALGAMRKRKAKVAA